MTESRENFLPWVIFPAILLIYLCFPTKNYFFDGVAFADAIESAPGLHPSLLHPSHLIYNVLGYFAYKLIQATGVNIRALAALQITDSILSVLSAFVLFKILKLSLRSLYLCYVLTLLFAFSATWWKFSTDADAYIPSVLFLLISFYLIHPANPPKLVLVALTYSMSMFFHQLAVVAFPVFALGLFLQTHSLSLRRRALTVWYFGLLAFIVTIFTYYCCFYLASGTLSFANFIRWITYRSPDGSFSFDVASNLSYTLRGHARLFFGGRVNLFKTLIEPSIARLVVVLIALISVFALVLVKTFRERFIEQNEALKDTHRIKSLKRLCIVWISLYIVFLFSWQPQHTFYRMFYLPALVLLCGLVLDPSEVKKARRPWRAISLVFALSLANFLFLIYPYSHVRKETPLSLAIELNRIWSTQAVIYYAESNSDNLLVRYFNPSTIWKPLDKLEGPALENELQAIYDQGGTVWVETSAINRISSSAEGREWLSSHVRKNSVYELTDPAYKLKFMQIVPLSHQP